MNYEPVIGLEIHAELKTWTKMFCDSLNDPDEKHPNINVCPICMGHPGTLPVINKKAVEFVIKAGLALGAKIPEFAKFDRKNYFYPDLPKGYQISQYDLPFCLGGSLNIDDKDIAITRVHLEEDTGRSIHPVKGRGPHGTLRPKGADYSLVDFNRAGVPLMELVTEPDIRSGDEARKFAQELQLILRYLGVSDANMEKGQMRVEANISLREIPQNHAEPFDELRASAEPRGKRISGNPRPDQSKSVPLGTKVEIKNLNSFRAVGDAIAYEIERQAELLDREEKIVQETRGWDEDKRHTFSQRSKEEAQEYRYFPEPDLPPIRVGVKSKGQDIDVEKLRAEISELPPQRRIRFKTEYGVKDEDIEIFVVNKELGDYYEQVSGELASWFEAESSKADSKETARIAANYIISDLQKLMSEKDASVSDLLITPENFAELIKMIYKKELSSRAAKDVLLEMFGTGKDPSQIVEDKGVAQVSDEATIEKIVDEIIKNNPQAVADYKKGKDASIQFLVGQVVKETKGAANPEIARAIILGRIVGG